MDTALVTVETETGTAELVGDVDPVPNLPESFEPQHCTAPVANRAQLWLSPVETETALVMFRTLTGTVEEVVVPSPSCPDPLEPQH
jgi:hypothetical protein